MTTKNFKLTQAERDAAVASARIGMGNNTPYISAKLKIVPNARSIIRSVATQFVVGTPFETVLSLMAGKEMRVAIYSATNVVGYVDAITLDNALETTVSEASNDWIDFTDIDAEMEKAKHKFTDDRMGLDVTRFIDAYPDDIADIFNRVVNQEAAG